MSKITDATRSVKRTIKNNFLDDDRQEAIEDFLMYPQKPLPPVISKCERFRESAVAQLTYCFNVMGIIQSVDVYYFVFP